MNMMHDARTCARRNFSRRVQNRFLHNYECRILFIQRMTDMEYTHVPNINLIARLIGAWAAKRLYRGMLDHLFRPEAEPSRHHETLAVARELVSRWLAEELQRGDALAPPESVREYLRLLFAGEQREIFVALFLDTQNRLIAAEKLFFGTLAQTSVYPREVVKRTLQLNAGAVIFAHNHPSGVCEPSRADELLTQSLKQALGLVDVRVLDHFVVAGPRTVSFAERGLL
jgi:DNA repair protein RadC